MPWSSRPNRRPRPASQQVPIAAWAPLTEIRFAQAQQRARRPRTPPSAVPPYLRQLTQVLHSRYPKQGSGRPRRTQQQAEYLLLRERRPDAQAALRQMAAKNSLYQIVRQRARPQRPARSIWYQIPKRFAPKVKSSRKVAFTQKPRVHIYPPPPPQPQRQAQPQARPRPQAQSRQPRPSSRQQQWRPQPPPRTRRAARSQPLTQPLFPAHKIHV